MATSKEALAKFDKLVAEIRGKSEPPTEFSDPDEVTSRHEVEEIARSAVENAIRAKEPSQPHIEIVFPKAPSSDPPSSRKRGNTLLGIAAIITALGGAAGVQQCASQARQSVPVKPNAQKL